MLKPQPVFDTTNFGGHLSWNPSPVCDTTATPTIGSHAFVCPWLENCIVGLIICNNGGGWDASTYALLGYNRGTVRIFGKFNSLTWITCKHEIAKQALVAHGSSRRLRTCEKTTSPSLPRRPMLRHRLRNTSMNCVVKR